MTLNRNKTYGVITVVTLVAAVVLQCTQEYRLYAKETEHLWLNDWMWISRQLRVPGGFVQLFSSFFTQLFGLWGMGTLILSLLFGLAFMWGWKIQRNVRISDCFMSFWLIPLCFMFLCNEHSYFNLRGHFAMLLAIVAGWGYTKVQKKKVNWGVNVLLCFVLTAVMYWTVGSAAVLTTCIIVLYEMLRSRRWLPGVVSVIVVLLMAWLSVREHYYINYEEALTPLQYYEWPSTYFFPLYAWLSVPLILIFGKFLDKENMKPRTEILICSAGVIISVVMLFSMYKTVHNERVYLLRQDEWMARNEDWEGIVSAHQKTNEPTAFISYLNLALAERGELIERMGEFRPYVAWSDEAQMYSPVLMSNDELSRDALKLQSCVFMKWGGAALANAQKAAFEANLLTPGETDPIELQRLVITNILFDAEKTAQKYLRRLERTNFYKEWKAEGGLWTNKDVEIKTIDEEVAYFRKSLPLNDDFHYKTQIGKMLRQIAMQTPENKIATQFYEAYLILSQDTTALRHWKEFIDTSK